MSQTIAPALRFATVCEMHELPVGLGRAFRVGDTPLAVFRTRTGKVFAVDGVCPHRGGPLADGMLAGDQVVCPYHAFRFDARSGDCDQAGVCSIKSYPVDVRDGAVVVTV